MLTKKRKEYVKEYGKKYREINREKIREHKKQYSKNNPEKIKKRNKQYREDNPEKIKEYAKRWYENNKDKIIKYGKNRSEYKKQYRLDNKEEIKKYWKMWRENNYKSKKEYNEKWYKSRRKTNLKFNLNCRITIAIWHSLKKGNKKAGRHWESLVGYTLNDLIKRLKKTMPEGYIWNDYLNGKLHIDHIIPIAVFHFDKAENPDFQKCWSLKNLRLLPAKENISKGAKIDKPFQPALKLFLKL